MVKKKKNLKKNLALVFGSGGAKGLSYIPILESIDTEFKKFNIRPDLLIGSSMGSLILALYALGKLEDFKKEVMLATPKNVARLFISKPSRYGLINGLKIEKLIKKYVGNTLIQDLPIKYMAVATDIKTGQKIIIDKGLLWKAIRASTAIPGIFTPIKIGDLMLVDGGVTNPLPVDIAKKLCKKVIAVKAIVNPFDLEVERIIESEDHWPNLIEIMINVYNIMAYDKIKELIKKADVAIEPEIFDIKTLQFYKFQEAFNIGTKEINRDINKVRRLLRSLTKLK